MSQIFFYGGNESQPAPFVRVNLSDIVGSTVLHDLDAKVDSGASVTIVPHAIVQRLGAAVAGHSRIEGLGGQSFLMPIHQLWLIVHGFPAVVVNAVSDPHESVVLLGRDVLNEHVVTLDGPNGRVEFADP